MTKGDYISRKAVLDMFDGVQAKVETLQDAINFGEILNNLYKNILGLSPVAVGWIPIGKCPMTKDEREEYSERTGYALEDDEAFMYSSLPGDGETVLTCSRYGTINIDTFYDDDEGCYFVENGEMDGIEAWMELPDPYVNTAGGKHE